MKLYKFLLLFSLLALTSDEVIAADAKLSALTQGTCADLYYGEQGSSSRKYTGCPVFNIKDYGAVGDGSTNDHTAIQNAINDAITAGGGTVYFPALAGSANCYLNNSTLVFTGGSGSGTRLISLVGQTGQDINGSRICSQFGGTSTNVSGAVISGGAIRLTVTSTAAFVTGDYVRVASVGGSAFANAAWAVTVVDGTHLDLVNSGANLGGAYTSGGTVQLPGYVFDAPSVGGASNLHKIQGLYISNTSGAGAGVRWGDVTTGGIYESLITAGLLGVDLSTNVFIVDVKDSQIIGTDNTGTGLYMGQVNVTGSSFTGWNYAIVTRNVGEPICGNRFEVNNVAVLAGSTLGNRSDDTSSSLKLCANSYERNLYGVFIRSISTSSLENETITGSIGPDYFLTGTSTWATGTVTATSLRPHGRSGTGNCLIENAVPSGYNTGHVSCTFTGSNTISYPVASDPGANSNPGAWAVEIQNGIVVCSMTTSSIRSSAVSVSPIASGGFGIDFQGCGGFGSQNYNEITSSGLGSFNLPTGPNKAGWVVNNGNNSNKLSFSMVFADLPGQLGNNQTPALFGSSYDLTDCGTVVWGANALGGSAGTNCRVWYNGANWTVFGK